VVATPGGVWVGTSERSVRQGLTFVADDLQRYATEEGPPGTGFGATLVRSLLARDGEVWAATDGGIVRVGPDGRTQRLRRVEGLPDDEVFGLSAGPTGVWVATARGLALVPSDSTVERCDGPQVLALAVLAAGDSAWAGLTEGLALVTPDGVVRVAPGSDTLPELRSAIVALARRADTLVAATVDRLLWRSPDGVWHVERVLSEVAPIYALAADVGGLWVGGRGGLLRFHLGTHGGVPYLAPGDVPGMVLGIAPADRYVWVATDAGLVRFTRDVIDR
jgi:ligand-binding sensor domain-containing protein